MESRRIERFEDIIARIFVKELTYDRTSLFAAKELNKTSIEQFQELFDSTMPIIYEHAQPQSNDSTLRHNTQ